MGTHISRRAFLSFCGVAATAAAGGHAAYAMATEGTAKSGSIAVADLTLDTFKNLVGQQFEVAMEGQTVRTLELSQAKTLEGRHTENMDGQVVQHGFRLTFSGSPKAAMEQGLYTFRHPAIGECALMAVPVVSGSPDTRHYEVLFNNLIAH